MVYTTVHSKNTIRLPFVLLIWIQWSLNVWSAFNIQSPTVQVSVKGTLRESCKKQLSVTVWREILVSGGKARNGVRVCGGPRRKHLLLSTSNVWSDLPFVVRILRVRYLYSKYGCSWQWFKPMTIFSIHQLDAWSIKCQKKAIKSFQSPTSLLQMSCLVRPTVKNQTVTDIQLIITEK